MYSCYAKSLDIDSRKSSFVARVDGKHLRYYDNSKVIAVKAKHMTLKNFPRGLENLFPNIKSVYIISCGLTEITQHDLESLTNLLGLDLWENKIQTIPKDLFKFNTKLAHISFTDNKLTFIDPNVFDNLDGLVSLFLDKTSNFDWEPCDNIRIENNRYAVKEAIKNLSPKCYELNKSDEQKEIED